MSLGPYRATQLSTMNSSANKAMLGDLISALQIRGSSYSYPVPITPLVAAIGSQQEPAIFKATNSISLSSHAGIPGDVVAVTGQPLNTIYGASVGNSVLTRVEITPQLALSGTANPSTITVKQWRAVAGTYTDIALLGQITLSNTAVIAGGTLTSAITTLGNASTSQIWTLTPSGSLTSGSFTINYRGNAFTATSAVTAGNLQTGLRALPNLGGTTVTCAGGPFSSGTAVTVTAGSTLANTLLPNFFIDTRAGSSFVAQTPIVLYQGTQATGYNKGVGTILLDGDLLTVQVFNVNSTGFATGAFTATVTLDTLS